MIRSSTRGDDPVDGLTRTVFIIEGSRECRR